MRGGGVSVGGSVPGQVHGSLYCGHIQSAAARRRLLVRSLQTQRDGSPECSKALHLHRQHRLCYTATGNFIKELISKQSTSTGL